MNIQRCMEWFNVVVHGCSVWGDCSGRGWRCVYGVWSDLMWLCVAAVCGVTAVGVGDDGVWSDLMWLCMAAVCGVTAVGVGDLMCLWCMEWFNVVVHGSRVWGDCSGRGWRCGHAWLQCVVTWCGRARLQCVVIWCGRVRLQCVVTWCGHAWMQCVGDLTWLCMDVVCMWLDVAVHGCSV